MRITNNNLMSNYLYNLNRNLKRMQTVENQLSTGKQISRPSDDPYLTTRIMNLNASISQNEKFETNIEDSIGWVDTTDSALQSITDVLQRVRELTVQGANGTYSESDLKSMSEEIGQNIEHIAQLGNSNYDGRYIFGGEETLKAPFEVVGGLLTNVNGDDGNITREISKDVTMDINITAERIVNGGSGEDLGTTLKNIYDRILSGDQELLSNDSLKQLDQQLDRVLGYQAEIGAKDNRLNVALKKNESETLNMTELLSNAEDIDFAEKVMEFSMMETIYNASLQTGAKILRPSLLDYL